MNKLSKFNQKGTIYLPILIAAFALVGFLFTTSNAPLKDRLFSMLYPKPASEAAKGGPVLKVGPKGRFQTINEALAVAKPGVKIVVSPGTYNEKIVLKDRVDLYLEDGVIIDYSAKNFNYEPTITDGTAAVNVTIDGFGVIKRSGLTLANGDGLDLNNPGSTLVLKCKQINVDTRNGHGIYVGYGNLTSLCDVNSASGYAAVRTDWQAGNVNLEGNFYNADGYGILAGGGVVKVKGKITADQNSAMHCSQGQCEFTGIATSNGLFGFEMSGGTALIHDSTIISNVNNGRFEEEDSINKYGGEVLTLDNVTILTKGQTARSIGEQGHPDSVTILRTSYANKPKSDLITIRGGELKVDPTLPVP